MRSRRLARSHLHGLGKIKGFLHFILYSEFHNNIDSVLFGIKVSISWLLQEKEASYLTFELHFKIECFIDPELFISPSYL